MGIFDLWREARGNVMRKELADVRARLRNANEPALRGFYGRVEEIENIREVYRAARDTERKQLLKEARKSSSQMWDQGYWPQALAVAICCLNAEAEFVPGDDAAYVKAETDKMVVDAEEFFKTHSRY